MNVHRYMIKLILLFFIFQVECIFGQVQNKKVCGNFFVLNTENEMTINNIKINCLDTIKGVNGFLRYKAFNCKGKLYYEVQTDEGIIYSGFFSEGKKVVVVPFLTINEFGNEVYVNENVVYPIKNGKWFRSDKSGKVIEVEIWKKDKLLKTITKK